MQYNTEYKLEYNLEYNLENSRFDIDEAFCRSRLLLGEAALTRLASAKVAIFGLGGVGGYCLEALTRSGIGQFLLVDGDSFALSNLNRQLLALLPDVGRPKVAVAAERVRLINPECWVDCREEFFSPENGASFDLAAYDYVVDAIDSVRAKVELICQAKAAGVPIISCLGAGNKLNPMGFMVADIYETAVCPLARVMRHELRKRGVAELKVVYSQEPPLKSEKAEEAGRVTGSVAFVPPAAGLLLASEVVRHIIKEDAAEEEALHDC